MSEEITIDLTTLENQDYFGCKKSLLTTMTESASVCFNNSNHKNPVNCIADGLFTKDYIIKYKAVDESMKATYNDRDRAVEDGSYSIAFAVIEAHTGLQPMLKSAKGNGFDYRLGKKTDNILGFDPKVRLEVSGIFHSKSSSTIEKRYKEKLDRLSKYDISSPAYIVIVEYSKPLIKVGGLNV